MSSHWLSKQTNTQINRPTKCLWLGCGDFWLLNFNGKWHEFCYELLVVKKVIAHCWSGLGRGVYENIWNIESIAWEKHEHLSFFHLERHHHNLSDIGAGWGCFSVRKQWDLSDLTCQNRKSATIVLYQWRQGKSFGKQSNRCRLAAVVITTTVVDIHSARNGVMWQQTVVA